MQEGNDLTKGNVFKNMIKFCIPLLITNLLNSMYNIVDGMWVGKLIGDKGVATITNAWPIILAGSSILAGITVTTSVMIAQRFSSKDKEKIKNVITPLYLVSIILGVITSIGLIISLDFWFDLFNTPNEILEMSRQYMSIYLVGYIFNFFAMTIIEGIRATGNSKTPLVILTISMVVNVILDPILINLGMGIKGAAWATTIAMIVCLINSLIYIYKKSPLLKFSKEHTKIEKTFLKEASIIGLPMMVEEFSTIITIMVEVYVSNSLGIVGSSAYGVISKLQQVVWVIGGTVRTLMTVVIGQFIGAGDYTQLRVAMKNGAKLIIAPTIIIALFLVVFSRPFCYIFTNNIEVIEAALRYLSVVGISFVSVPLCQLLYGFILGTGNTRFTFVSCLLASIAEVIIVLYIYNNYNSPLTALGLGIDVWYVILITMCYIYYKLKKWENV